MIAFDLTKELLPGLPAYEGGRMSDAVYDAGDGFYDIRAVDGDPGAIPFFTDGQTMSETEFNAAVSALDRSGIRWHYMYARGGIGLRMYVHYRIVDIRFCGGRISAAFVDDYAPAERNPVLLRAVTETDETAFRGYLDRLCGCGLEKRYESLFERNVVIELACDGGRVHAWYTPGDATARFVLDRVSAGIEEFGYSAASAPGKTEIYQFGLNHTGMKVGFSCDCGMCYIIKLSDNALFFVDGGENEQATEAATAELWRFMHEITGTPEDGIIRIAGYFCTHAHDDHMDMFSHLAALYHEHMDVQRVMFNFVADSFVPLCPQTYLLINRIRKYYPDVIYRKLHMGDAFTLADTQFAVLQTHEDSIGAAGNEKIGGFNDTSTVLKISFDGRSFLILGDIDDGAEAVLLRHYTGETLHADVVQCAHHVFNRLEYLYDVIDADYAFVPQGERVRTNHDSPKYNIIARTVPYDNFFFSDNGTDGLRVNTETAALEHHYHAPKAGGVYDGMPL